MHKDDAEKTTHLKLKIIIKYYNELCHMMWNTITDFAIWGATCQRGLTLKHGDIELVMGRYRKDVIFTWEQVSNENHP